MSTSNATRADAGEFFPNSLDLPELAEAVTEAARGLRFGSIEVVVHEARVVQIIRTEKRRISK